MIHSLLLARDCETTTSSSSSSQLYPCPGSIDHDHGALPVGGQEQEEDNGEQEQSVKHDGRSDAGATNLLKSSKPDRGGQGTTIKLSLSDPTISLLPFKPIHDDSSPRNSGRVCVDCNTTKTPLWRSGPKGPKSLCNACGIRHRKARRALAANSAGDDPSKFPVFHRSNLKRPKLQQHLDPTVTSKKRTKTAFSGYSHCSSDKKLQQKGSHQLCFHMENLHVGSDHHEKEELYYDTNSFRRVFPKDEEEAAVLLMALSCGLVHG